MLTNEDIARAFLREAQSDLNSACALLTASEYARCIAHAQHTVEKTLKAVLAARGTVITDRHQVSPDFAALCADVPDAARIAQISARLENIGSRSEYPLLATRTAPSGFPPNVAGKPTPNKPLTRRPLCSTRWRSIWLTSTACTCD